MCWVPSSSVFSYDCTASHISNEIVKYADDTTVMGLDRNTDEAAHRRWRWSGWQLGAGLRLNVVTTKEMVTDYRNSRPAYSPFISNGVVVKRVQSIKFKSQPGKRSFLHHRHTKNSPAEAPLAQERVVKTGWLPSPIAAQTAASTRHQLSSETFTTISIVCSLCCLLVKLSGGSGPQGSWTMSTPRLSQP